MKSQLPKIVLALAAVATSALAADSPLAARNAEPVVVSGIQLLGWSRLAATGLANPYPSGALDETRSAHNGTIVVPPDVRTGVPVEEIVAYKWNGAWQEIPVQVDERFPYFLANGRSDFGIYSGTDEELTYVWDDESWKKTGGTCSTLSSEGIPTADPVAGLDDDDEVVFMASDAGAKAPADGPAPSGADASSRKEIALVDALDLGVSYVYLFLKPGGSSFNAANGYVHYERDANADEWIDEKSFLESDPEKLGSSNHGYGPNIPGTVCVTASTPGDPTPRASDDRWPRDGVTVSTAAYRWHASGRWMVREMHVAKPGQPGVYGPDLIDRWKGRAFQSSPDSSISLVGFEDEQVNWEANSSLLGERRGPVRAIREIWGADSGTNVTKTETFYRDAVVYRYHVRVHPIPPDGLYTNWDYNDGVAVKYYNAIKPEGVDIDGVNDDLGNIDEIGGAPAFFDLTDPTFELPVAIYNWEQVSGHDDIGSLVYLQEIKGATSAENPAITPFYRDDACFDDGTGDNPVPRPWPGEASTDSRVIAGYGATADCMLHQKQGAFGSHGVHYLFTGDTDNAFSPKPVTETDGQQWQFAVPTDHPHAVGQPYGNAVIAPLIPVVTN
jgi:hypothetical protein